MSLYQNCAPSSGGGSPFQISLSSTGSTLNISSINMSQTTLNSGAAFSATATAVSANPITCQWAQINSSNAIVAGPVITAAVSGLCSYNANAPATNGSYHLTLLATDSSQNSGQASVSFQVGAGSTPSPTPAPGATPAPSPSGTCGTSGTTCYTYTTGQSPNGGSCSSCCNGYNTSCQYFGSYQICTDKCN